MKPFFWTYEIMEAGTFSLVPLDVIQDSRLTLRHIKVLVALFSFRNKTTDIVFPSRQKLSECTGLPISRISTTTTQLEKLGWLEKDGKGGFSKATRYKLTVPDLDTVTEAVTVTETVTQTVTDSVTGGVTDLVTNTVTDLVTRKEHTNEYTNEQTIEHTKQDAVDLFDDFWKRYPNKTAKGKAVEAWAKIKNKEQVLEQIIDALKWQTDMPKWCEDNGKYIPHPATYLSQQRWLDEQPMPTKIVPFETPYQKSKRDWVAEMTGAKINDEPDIFDIAMQDAKRISR